MAKFLCNGLPSRTTDWSKWRVFFCDERHVPFTDPECTYTIYKSKLVDNGGPLPGENIFPINPDLSGKFLYLQSRIYVNTWWGEVKWHRFLRFPITCSHLFLIQRFQIICQKNSSELIFVLVHHKHTSSLEAIHWQIVCIINLVLKIQHCTCPLLILQWRMQPRHTRRRSWRCLEEWTSQNSICCC